MIKKIFQDRAQLSFYTLLIMTVGLVLSGWFNVYLQYINLKAATIKATQLSELEIVRATKRAAEVYWKDQLQIHGYAPDTITEAQIREIETHFFADYIDPIELLVPEGDAWVIGYNNEMVFDKSVDFPYAGIPIDHFLPRAAVDFGAHDYGQMLSDVLTRHENTGQYVWSKDKGLIYAEGYKSEKGIEIGAWTPAVLDEKNNIKWMIGLTTPLAAIMKSSGARNSVNQSILFMSVVTIVIAIVFYSFVLGQRRVRALQTEVAQLKIEIDSAKKQQEVNQIVESEYFQQLKERAAKIRARSDR